MNQERIVVIDKGNAVEAPLYQSWASDANRPISFFSDPDINWVPPSDTGIIVTAQQYMEPEAIIIRNAMQSNIPVLIIADGIIEYRNTWLNPHIIPGSVFQSVAGHKIAVIGRAQARIIESWGVFGKCEIVGCPRFDPLLKQESKESLCHNSNFNILIATARTPAFTNKQKEAVLLALLDLKKWISETQQLDGKSIKATWRLSDNLIKDLNLRDNPNSSLGFAEVLQDADALITTPSTSMLEGMLCNIPVALLDYTNSPSYTPPAWSITSPTHIDSIIRELANPSEVRMLFQKMCLHDALECKSPSTPRMTRLISQMIEIGNKCRNQGNPLTFPSHILPEPSDSQNAEEHPLHLAALFPETPSVTTKSSVDLQVENGHLLRLARQQQKYIMELHQHIGEINGVIKKSSPLYAKLLRIFSHPKRPNLEDLD